MRVPGQTVTKLGNEGLVECPVVTGKYYWGENSRVVTWGGKLLRNIGKIFSYSNQNITL